MTNVHVRTAPLEYSEGQLFGRLVPLNVSARVADVLPDGQIDVYEEGFRPDVFDRQLRSDPAMIRRVGFWHTHEHNDGAGYFGPASNLEQRADGIYGEFRVLTSKRDDLRDLMDEGIVNLSIEFKERVGGTSIDDSGVRWRTSAHLHGVALDPRGAYPGAEVLAFRSIDDLLEERAAELAARAAAEARERADSEAEERERAEREAKEAADREREREQRELEEWLKAERDRAAAS